MAFVGRANELSDLTQMLETIRRGERDRPGIAVLLRGRRRVGKSRLAEELIRRTGSPSVYFQAARGADSAAELATFAQTIADSDLPSRELANSSQPQTLSAALTLLAACLPLDQPSIVVLDELPWLLEGFPGGAGELQRVWDRQLSKKPVLLVLLGSDIGMMESLSQPQQPFFGRATEMTLDALNPLDIGEMLGLKPMDAFDAYLITGGQPLVAQEWERGMSRQGFLQKSFSSSTSALVVAGARVLDSEFPGDMRAHQILRAIGGRGERSFTGIAQAAGGLPHDQLVKGLSGLAAKRVVAADEPLSARAASKDRRWRISDPALRFWLAFVEPNLGAVDRGRPDLALARVASGFDSWRGRAIEPVVRDALGRLLPDSYWPDANAVGGWWNRSNNPEIDLVGANDRPADNVAFVGTIKWRARGRVTGREIDQLSQDALKIPGVVAGTALVAVCPAGVGADPRITQAWNAADLLSAWEVPNIAALARMRRVDGKRPIRVDPADL